MESPIEPGAVAVADRGVTFPIGARLLLSLMVLILTIGSISYRSVAQDPPLRAAAMLGPEEQQCRLDPVRYVEPPVSRLGTELQVKMEVRADCTAARRPVSLVFVVDRSSWQGDADVNLPDQARIEGIADALETYVGSRVDFTSSKVGLLVYDEQVQVLQSMTSDPAAFVEKLDRIRVGRHVRDPAAALDRARTLVAGEPEERVIVLFGGNLPSDAEALSRSADRIHRAGITLVVLQTPGGETQDEYRDLVDGDHYRITSPDPSQELHWLASERIGLAILRLEAYDHLLPAVRFERGTGGPHRLRLDLPQLSWDLLSDQAPSGSGQVTEVETYIGYVARSEELGTTSVGDPVYLDIWYTNGVRRQVPFPTVEVEIIPPQPTEPPTASPTSAPTLEATASPTAPTATSTEPSASTVHLPMLWR